MAKKVDPKAKAKRQKVLAGAGAFLFVAVLAIQVPRTMKMLNAPVPEPPPPAAPAAAGAGGSGLAAPSAAGGAVPVAATNGELSDSDPPPRPASGHIVAFGRFASKDPFAQQVDPDAMVAPAAAPVATRRAATAPRTTPAGGAAAPSAPPAGVVTPTPSGPVSSAVIAVNGVEETVAVKAEFPKDEPIFRLVAATATTARIGIAGGALASGEPTVTLRKGKPMTLVNTADGVRYELELVSTA